MAMMMTATTTTTTTAPNSSSSTPNSSSTLRHRHNQHHHSTTIMEYSHLEQQEDYDYDDDPLLSTHPNDDDDDDDDDDDCHDEPLNSDAAMAVYRLYLDGVSVEDRLAAAAEATTTTFPWGAVANVCSATLGAGVLSLPYAMLQAGIVAGMILLGVAGMATILSITTLIQASEYYQISTYEGLAERVLNVRRLVESSVLIFCGGCAVAYVIAINDILKKIIPQSQSTTMALVALYVFAMVPLSMLKKIQSLQFASMISMAAIGTLLFTAILHLYAMHNNNTSSSSSSSSAVPSSSSSAVHLRDYWAPNHGLTSILTATPVVLFAFSCQVNVCQIYQELSVRRTDAAVSTTTSSTNKKERVMFYVTILAVTVCATLYSSISLVGLADFGNALQPNLLSCYQTTNSNHHPAFPIADMAMGLAILLAFPLNIFPARGTILGWIWQPPPPSFQSHGGTGGAIETISLLQTPFLQNDDNNNSDRHIHTTDTKCDAECNTDQQISNLGTSLDEEEQPQGEGISHGLLEIQDPIRVHENDLLDRVPYRLHVVTTLFLTGIVLAFALILPNISVVFGLLGGTAASVLGFCVPGGIGIRMSDDIYEETGQSRVGTKMASYTLLVGGTIVGILTTVVTLYNTIVPTSTSSSPTPR